MRLSTEKHKNVQNDSKSGLETSVRLLPMERNFLKALKILDQEEAARQEMIEKGREVLTRISHRKSTATPSQAVFAEDARLTVLNIPSGMFPGFVCRISINYNPIGRFVTISCEKYGLKNWQLPTKNKQVEHVLSELRQEF